MEKQVDARVYVGTYHKYNCGSIKGAWLTLSDYADKDAFFEACAELHKDENDPEFMFQDFEGIPEGMIGESFIKDEVWEWLEMDENDLELLEVYRKGVDSDADLETAKNCFNGTAESMKAWAEEFLEQCGALDLVPESLRYHIDFQSYAEERDIEGWYFVKHEGEIWVFSPNC